MSHLSLVRQVERLPPAPPARTGASLDTLAQRAVGGEVGAVAELLAALLPAVRSSCRALLGSSHPDLDDAVQSALIELHHALPRYRFECSVLHYAVRISFRTTHGYRRRLRLLAERFLPTAADSDLNDARAPQPADTAVMAERSEALRRVITKLPAAQAEALLMHVALEYSIAEVAAISDVSVDTVKTRLKLGKDSLRRRIGRDPALRSILGGKP